MNKYQEALIDIKCDSYNYIENNYEDGFKQCYKEQFDLLQELVDKATPKKTIKKPIIRDRYRQYKNYCPVCNQELLILGNYCLHCGQAVDWSHKDE